MACVISLGNADRVVTSVAIVPLAAWMLLFLLHVGFSLLLGVC